MKLHLIFLYLLHFAINVTYNFVNAVQMSQDTLQEMSHDRPCIIYACVEGILVFAAGDSFRFSFVSTHVYIYTVVGLTLTVLVTAIDALQHFQTG